MPTPAKYRVCSSVALLAAGASIALSGGCDKQEPIRAYQAPKEAPHVAVAPAAPAPAGAPQWTVPDGWTPRPAGQMLMAAFNVAPDAPSAVCTVAMTPAGIPLVENVNRWEKQLGLPASSEADLSKVVTQKQLPAGSAQIVDLLGPEPTDTAKPRQRTTVALFENGGHAWYFKLAGPADVVSAQRPKFDAFIQSVHFDGTGSAPADQTAAASTGGTSGDLPAGHPPIGPAAPSSDTAGPPAPGTATGGAAGVSADGSLKWTTPAGWIVGAGGSSMRTATFEVPTEAGKAEVTVIHLGGAIPRLQNVNRWRGQVGLKDVASDNEAGGEPVKVSGTDATLYDFAGAQQRILVALVPHEGEWYFKMTGPPAAVAAQKDAFKAFLASVQLVGS